MVQASKRKANKKKNQKKVKKTSFTGFTKKTDRNKNVYEGNFKNGKRCGKGKMKYSCCRCCIYDGEWRNNFYHGKGKVVYCRKRTYEGEFRYGYYDGEGKMAYSNGNVYNGKWKDGRKHGVGQMMYSNGQIYYGTWRKNKYHGYGKMLYPFDMEYHGEWEFGLYHGKGRMIVNQGIFEGDFYKGRMIKGNMYYENQDVVEIFGPELVYGKTHLRGRAVYDNGNSYEGSFFDITYRCAFIKQGIGCMNYANGDKYIGEWVNGCKEGHGKYLYANGDMYEGQWKYGSKFGNGKYTYTDGRNLQGIFSRCMYNSHDVAKYVTVEDNDKYARKLMEEIKYGEDLDDTSVFRYEKAVKKFCVYFDKLSKKRYFQILYCGKLIFSSEIRSNHNDDEIFMLIRNLDCLELCNKNEITVEELDKINCPISMYPMINPVTLCCGHTFDEKNINKFILENSYEVQYCPLCRREITNYYVNDEIDNVLKKCTFQYNNVIIETEFLQLLKKTNAVDLLNFKKANPNAWVHNIVPNE